MQDRREYWNDKENRANVAKNHTREMTARYQNEINASIQGSLIFSPGFTFQPEVKKATNVFLKDCDTVSAGFEYAAGKTAVLNFASYKNAGGMFLEGSKAQEECLCHESFLYNVLSGISGYYDWNQANLNRALYKNRAIYSPNVRFIHKGQERDLDVITCASPNKSAAQKYAGVTDEENDKVLEDRIRFVLEVAAYQKVNTLILGAYGCGVFGQDPELVAKLFQKYVVEIGAFETVVYAVPDGRNGNLAAFQRVIR